MGVWALNSHVDLLGQNIELLRHVGRIASVTYEPFPSRFCCVRVESDSIPEGEEWRGLATFRVERTPAGATISVTMARLADAG